MKLAMGSLAAAMASVVAAVFFASGKVVAVITYMVSDVVVVTPMVLFWGLAVGVLNPKESKRWFGLIGAAGTVGCIVAGYVVSLASRSERVDVISLGQDEPVQPRGRHAGSRAGQGDECVSVVRPGCWAAGRRC